MQSLNSDPVIKTWAEIKSQTLNWLSHPGAPTFEIDICF